MKSLSDYRMEIDAVDGEIIKLLEKRIHIAEDVARYKLENNMKVFDESREAAVLEKIASKAPDDIKSELVGTFDGIMNMSKLRQYRLKSRYSRNRELFDNVIFNSLDIDKRLSGEFGDFTVGVQGIAGAYSELSARAMFPSAKIKFYADWAEIFTALKNGEIEYGVLPVENSTYGSVSDVYRLIIDNDAFVVASNRLKVEHCLLAKPGAGKIHEVISHPQALGQCSEFITQNVFKATTATNTAVAAEAVAKSDRDDFAAIARDDCAEKYGLEILARGIQNEPHNATRFAAVSRKLEISGDANKISIRFSLAHKEGTLSRLLGYFAALGLNLTKIESRPIPSKPFEYRFYIDFMGTMRDDATFDLICALSDELADFRFMGNYHENESDSGVKD